MQTRAAVIPYSPRPQFAAYHAHSKRFAVGVCHRRAGKTHSRINKLIRAAVTSTVPRAQFGYVSPTFAQSKNVAWEILKHYASPVTSKGNESDLSVTTVNGATIRLYSAEAIERMRGLGLCGIVMDEAQDIAASAMHSVILPALTDHSGWLEIVGTSRGWGNLLGKTYKQALTDDEWYVQMLTASESGIIPSAELQLMRQSMPENVFAQEFDCSFDAAIVGAYYAKDLVQAQAEKRIARVPYDRAAKVHTAWDIGVADATVIWFFQLVGREIRWIDCYSASGHGLDHYAAVLQDKKYLYGDHWAPHDIAVREFGSGRSRIETASMLGIEFKTAPNLPVKDGIDAVRMVLNRCWFDEEKCAEGLDALRQYREKTDPKTGVAVGPLHDWTSHHADAMRYGVVAFEEEKINQRQEARNSLGMAHAGGWMR